MTSGAKSGIQNRTADWCVWKIAVPGTILVLFWPIYHFILHLDHSFERAFSHGDLLIFSALLLLEAALEGDHASQQRFWPRLGRQLARGMAVILIFIFGFMKYDVIMTESTLARASGELVDSQHSDGDPSQPSAAKVGPDDQDRVVDGNESSAISALKNLGLYSRFNLWVALGAIIVSITALFTGMEKENTQLVEEIKLS